MKVSEAISKFDNLMHNTYTSGNKVEWLSALDGDVKRLIIDTHEGGEDVTFNGYTEGKDEDTVLLIPAPFEQVYLYWLEAHIHYYNGEYTKYNNALDRYEERYQAFANEYTRTHRPKVTRPSFF